MSEIAAVVLAAGLASRYRAAGGAAPSKLVAEFRGAPLVRWAVEAALASRARPVLVVTGHAQADVAAALAGLHVTFAHNPDFAEGLATSLRVGVAALPTNVAGAVVLLGDMPEVEAPIIDALAAVFFATPGAAAAMPLFSGQRGNPVLIGRELFGEVARLGGDEGARRLLQALPAERIATVEVADAGVTKDVDAPADFGSRFTLRDAAAGDRAAIIGGIIALQDYERTLSDARLPGAQVADAYYEILLREAQTPGGAMLVAEASGVFVGFAVGWIEQAEQICEPPDSNRYGYVSDIYVREEFRRSGAASALLAALEARLARGGISRLRLNVLAANAAARATYEKAGFSPYEWVYEKRVGGA